MPPTSWFMYYEQHIHPHSPHRRTVHRKPPHKEGTDRLSQATTHALHIHPTHKVYFLPSSSQAPRDGPLLAPQPALSNPQAELQPPCLETSDEGQVRVPGLGALGALLLHSGGCTAQGRDGR